MKTHNNTLLNQEGHLTDESLAYWVEATETNDFSKIPEDNIAHMEECMHCKQIYLELCDMLDGVKEVTDEQIDLVRVKRIRHVLPIQRIILMAASFLVLVTIGVLFYLSWHGKPNLEELYASNFNPYTDIVSDNGTKSGTPIPEDIEKKIEQKAFYYYNNQMFDSALVIFRNLVANKPESDTLSFYLANTALASNAPPDEAVRLLVDLTNRTSSAFYTQSRWYLVLAYIKINKPDEAIKELEVLDTTTDYKKQQVSKLLKELK